MRDHRDRVRSGAITKHNGQKVDERRGRRSNGSNKSKGQSCKYCKKTNHPSDRCFFKVEQPKPIKAHHKVRNNTIDQNGEQNGNNYPHKPVQSGIMFHDQIQWAKDDFSSLICVDQRQSLRRPVQANTSGLYGNIVTYELPLAVVRHETVADHGVSQGVEWAVQCHEHFVTDADDDVLMCDCNGSSIGCLSACAHTLFSQDGVMWMSKENRRALEKGMWNNRSARVEGPAPGQEDDIF